VSNDAGSADSLVGRSHQAAHTHDKGDHPPPVRDQSSLMARALTAGQVHEEKAAPAQTADQERYERLVAEEKSWVDFITQLRQKNQGSGENGGANNTADKDGFERGRGRSLPEEEQDKSRGR
jgi:hypothetical protein